ncbi:hypothetical protein BKA66DRAFT_574039 [Pyrenochaeta sp. MPI-SDFR-AT-0127]|nr:hypothetical protein BKA66DRAFT_574039 [Pyrenochaeta sp. MPI-SDFR-AT-0127]
MPVQAAIAPGEVNCRYTATTSATVNYYTCKEPVDWYYIAVADFLLWNLTVDVESHYGPGMFEFIQQSIPTDRFCGPNYGNASCIETDMPSCNGETWKCGNLDSCSPGTCYSGACLGFSSEYSMDGKYGSQNKDLKCVAANGVPAAMLLASAQSKQVFFARDQPLGTAAAHPAFVVRPQVTAANQLSVLPQAQIYPPMAHVVVRTDTSATVVLLAIVVVLPDTVDQHLDIVL